MFDYKFHVEAQKELKKLDNSIQKLFVKSLKKILENPNIGIELGNKYGMDLTGYKKLYFDKKRYKIVYKVVEQEILIYIIAVGKRDKMDVYKKASERKYKD